MSRDERDWDYSNSSAAYLLGFQCGTDEDASSEPEADDLAYLGSLLSEVLACDVAQSNVTAVMGQRLRPRLARFSEEGAETIFNQIDDRAFLRGWLHGAQGISSDEAGELVLMFGRLSGAAQKIAEAWLGPEFLTSDSVAVRGVAALDILGGLHEGDETISVPSGRAAYEKWRLRVTGLATSPSPFAGIDVQLVHPDAVLPRKDRISDSGYDLTLLYSKKSFGVTTLYGTGIIARPPQGWYLDVVARSSIIKLGYMVANSVGVIDRSYRGEIFIPLTKIDPHAPDLELPARVAQMIPRPIVHFPIRLQETLEKTDRGAGGFGSSGR